MAIGQPEAVTWAQAVPVGHRAWFRCVPCLLPTASGMNPKSPPCPARPVLSLISACTPSLPLRVLLPSFLPSLSQTCKLIASSGSLHILFPPLEGVSSRSSQGWFPPIITSLASKRLSAPPSLNKCPVSHPKAHCPVSLTLLLPICTPLGAQPLSVRST